MVTYIKIPVEYIKTFSREYLALTGEVVESNPTINKEGTHYIIGSSRVTADQITRLTSDHKDVSMGDKPLDWVSKEEEDERILNLTKEK